MTNFRVVLTIMGLTNICNEGCVGVDGKGHINVGMAIKAINSARERIYGNGKGFSSCLSSRNS